MLLRITLGHAYAKGRIYKERSNQMCKNKNPIHYLSHTHTYSFTNLHTIEKEAFAISYALQKLD